MFKVFHAPRTRSLRVLWMAEEMGIDYQIEPASLMEPSEAFLAANPTRTLPVVVLEDDAVLTESVAILQYMAAQYGPTPLEVPQTSPEYPNYLQFLFFGEATLAANLTPIVRTKFMAPDEQKDNWTVQNAAEVFLRQLKLVERRLGQAPFMAGDHFTAADISVGYALAFGAFLGLGDKYPPKVAAYWEKLQARPAFIAAASK